MVNGGGIRFDLLQGNLSFNDLISVFSFNYVACIAVVTEQQLLDVLEC